MDYNLVNEKWLPVLFNNGKVLRLSLKETLNEAHRIREIACSNPMDRFAVYRFLLAVLYWCKNDIAQHKDELDSIPSEWLNRLDQEQESFNLLGDGRRFYQVRGFSRPRTIADLMMYEIPSGNNIPHFIHANDAQNAMCPNCCVFALLRMPVFAILGGNTKPFMYAGINGALPFYNVESGRNFLETLLNVSQFRGDLGTPIWQKDARRPLPTEEINLLEGLTYLPRNVWFSEPEKGKCTNCGQLGKVIRTCNIESPGQNESEHWNDPNVTYKLEKKVRKSLKTYDITSPKAFTHDRPLDNLIRNFTEKGIDFEDCKLAVYAPVTDFKGKFCDFWTKVVNLPKDKTEQASDFKLKSSSSEFLNKANYAKNLIKDVKTSEVEKYRIPTPLLASLRPDIAQKVDDDINLITSKDENGIHFNPEFYNDVLKVISPSLFNNRSVIGQRHQRHFEKYFSANTYKSIINKENKKPKKGKTEDESTD